MRRVIGAADLEKRQLARYRLDQFFAAFIKEFARRTAPGIPTFDANTFRLVERDLKSAKRLMALRSKTRLVAHAPEVRAIAAEMRQHLKDFPGQGHLP